MKEFLAISIARSPGAQLRYRLSPVAACEVGLVFAGGILIKQIVGSFIVGLFATWTRERELVDPGWPLLVVVGFWGSFKTFLSDALKTNEHSQWGLLLANIFGNHWLRRAGALTGMALPRAL